MKDHILKSISYIFHPLLMPFLGVLFYFSKTPKFVPELVMKAKLFSILILTIILPILLYLLLKTLKKVDTIHLESTRERIVPLVISLFINLLIIIRIFPFNEIIELYYFFVGLLCSTLACLFLAFLKVKASIHMLGSCTFFMFAVGLSVHFKINVNGTLALMMIILGAIATSRLHMKAHSNTELIVGSFIGLFPQIVLLKFWL